MGASQARPGQAFASLKSCANLHAIYLAHHASDNVIDDNDFENTCGSPIRIRDSSNNNIASNNTFRQANYPAIFELRAVSSISASLLCPVLIS